MSDDNEYSGIEKAHAVGNFVVNSIIIIAIAFAILIGGFFGVGQVIPLPEVPHDAPHRQRQHVEQAYPTPMPSAPQSHGELAREEAKRIREERNRQFWRGR